MLQNLANLRQLPRELKDPYAKAYALMFQSGLPAKDVTTLSLISNSTYYRIANGGQPELRQSNKPTINRLAEGYDRLLAEYLTQL